MMPSSQPTDDKGLLSADMIAKVLMLNVSRIHQLGREGILPREAGGKYRLVPAIQGYIRFLKKDFEDDDVISYTKERARLTKVKREEAELELAARRRQVIPIDEVETEMASMAKTMVAALGPLADRLERIAKLTPDQVAYVDQIVRDIRTELYETLSVSTDQEAITD